MPLLTLSQEEVSHLYPREPTVSNVFGSVLVGTHLSFMLYGLLVNQMYKYFTVSKNDSMWLRTIVITTFVLETFGTVMHIHLSYYYFVKNFGNLLAFLHGVWSLNILSVATTLTMMTCQSFYAVRIWIVWALPVQYKGLVIATVVGLMGTALGVSVSSAVSGFKGITIGGFQSLMWHLLVFNASASAADIILTATMIYVLNRSRTGFRNTDSLINRLILYTISSGLLTTVFNILSLALVHIYGINNWIWLGTMMVAERLYANSLMAALNSRRISTTEIERHADPFGTVVQEKAVRFRSSTTYGEALELPQLSTRSHEASASGEMAVVDIKPSSLEGL